jgi:hypothetical protein
MLSGFISLLKLRNASFRETLLAANLKTPQPNAGLHAYIVLLQ